MGTAKQYHKKTASRGCYKSTSREWRNQKYCQDNLKKYQGVSQSEILPGTATIKKTARECRNKVHPGSATNRSTTRECHNQNDH